MNNQSNFIKTIMENDLNTKKHETIVTRFPPEPNGFLHIGHARAVVVNFELAKVFGGSTNLRYDDTNPEKEDDVYVKSILEDIRWLGYEPDNIFFASDYFQEMYERAIVLIKKGLAYVDHQTPQEMATERGNINTPGTESPYRNRSVEENLALFEDMKRGKFAEGECVLRAKIDMKSPNMNMRDPALYRIAYAEHHRAKKNWCIYPMYDYAHPLEDAIEGITHSLCSLEFEDHRPLYDWVVRETEMPHVPRQIEFGRLGVENTIMSKRYLRTLVEQHYVNGWDDPRMPTLSGLRRRGYTPASIRQFILSAGLSKINSTVSADMLEAAVRDDLQVSSVRMMGVIRPLKVTITNYEEGKTEYFDVPLHVERPELGTRKIPFSRHLWIEQDDFLPEKPNKKYKRLAKDVEVRLFHAYFITCHDCVTDDDGNVIEVLATYDPETRSGSGFDLRKPNGTIHYVESTTAVPATFNHFKPMITDGEGDYLERFDKTSHETFEGFVEQALKDENPGLRMQLIRNGYYVIDKDSTTDHLSINQTVPLKSSYKG
ncbi:MAG: glutamine--tRNA ligase/YqeY domain fusion protein [Acholeplasmataceae bacterium]|nr:glutamine--tRNA ligase/YqeY domain fusion protein [Acholeplasmataceae bacterium]